MAIIIVGHGRMPEAAKYSIKMITGMTDGIETVSLAPDQGNEDLTAQLEQILEARPKGEPLTIFSDLLGGSPNNLVVSRLFSRSDVRMVSGFNLPMLLSAVLTPNLTTEEIIRDGQQGIQDVIKKLNAVDEDEE
ncbi:MAG: PTS sugar transporter subunit IIA [Lactobacillus sp.]|jgi:mannose/fructose-specific phosphotransferase system component IIA|nr:PTS sugar transporter subunit IIA [Lactobacillus sp.]